MAPCFSKGRRTTCSKSSIERAQSSGIPSSGPCGGRKPTERRQVCQLDRLNAPVINADLYLSGTESTKSKPDPTSRLLACLRCFVFHLIDCVDQSGADIREARASGQEQWKNRVRLVRVAIKSAKSCLEGGEIGDCSRVLERAAEHEDKLGKVLRKVQKNDLDEDYSERVTLYHALRVEYLALRMMMVGHSNTLDHCCFTLRVFLGLEAEQPRRGADYARPSDCLRSRVSEHGQCRDVGGPSF